MRILVIIIIGSDVVQSVLVSDSGYKQKGEGYVRGRNVGERGPTQCAVQLNRERPEVRNCNHVWYHRLFHQRVHT